MSLAGSASGIGNKRAAYFDSHHDNEAVFDDFVVGNSLGLFLHDLAVGDQLLSFHRLAMCLLNQRLQLRYLQTRQAQHLAHALGLSVRLHSPSYQVTLRVAAAAP